MTDIIGVVMGWLVIMGVIVGLVFVSAYFFFVTLAYAETKDDKSKD